MKVFNDLLLTADRGHGRVLVFLDLNTAFNMTDHCILLHHLETWVGFKETALHPFHSRLKKRPFFVLQRRQQQMTVPFLVNFNCGVPQGSILGPLLFKYTQSLSVRSYRNIVSLTTVTQKTQTYMKKLQLH